LPPEVGVTAMEESVAAGGLEEESDVVFAAMTVDAAVKTAMSVEQRAYLKLRLIGRTSIIWVAFVHTIILRD
jgi:hypothetical protein